MRRFILCLATLLVPQLALAHHGPGTFELSKTIELSGKLTRIDLVNPHSWLYFENIASDGKLSRFRCEMRSVHVLSRSGWNADMFRLGQQIKITASPDRADPNSCYLQTIIFENGSRMDRYGQYVKADGGAVKEVRGPLAAAVDVSKRPLRRSSGEPNISGDWAAEQTVNADPRGVGGRMMPLGRINEYKPAEPPARAGAARGAAPAAGRGRGAAGPRVFGGTELTEAGNQKADAGRGSGPRPTCQPTSIIFDWTFDGPVNRITQNKDDVVILYGQFNLKRAVFMKLKEHPGNIKPSRVGHSIGRWERDTLVVDTVGFEPGSINRGIPHSGKLHIVERYTLDSKNMGLTRAWEADDVEYFKGTAKGQDAVYPAETKYTEDRCNDQTTLDYSKVGQSKK